jgi:hypothetical protein
MRRADFLLGIFLLGCGHHGGSHDGGADQGFDAAVMLGKANGMLGPWMSSDATPSALPPLTTPRANHCSVARAGRLYVMGGNYLPEGASAFMTLGDIQVADQNADGSLSAWRSAGMLPGPVNECTATTDGNNLYLVGGIFDDQTKDGQVWSAAFQADGSVAAFTSLGMLPADHDIVASQAFVRSGTLFVFDTTIGVEVDAGSDDGGSVEGGGTVLLHAPIGTTIGAWTVDQGPAGFRGRPQFAVTAQNVYALGGYLSDDANTVVTDGFGAAFSAQSGMGASFPASDLPAPRAFGNGAGVDDWVFVIGGKDSIFTGSGQPDVYAAQVGSDGELAAFTAVASMPEGRTNMDSVVLDNYLYVTGGGLAGGGLDNVFAARVRF